MTIDPNIMTIDPNIMTIDPNIMTIGPNCIRIDMNIMMVDPKKYNIDWMLWQLNWIVCFYKKTKLKITVIRGTFWENQDYETVIMEPFANDLAHMLHEWTVPLDNQFQLKSTE